jgi:hypothetical protein
MKDVSEKELKRVVSHCQRYSQSLQYVTYERRGVFFHDNDNNPVNLIYLCPICLMNKVGILSAEDYRSDDEFTIDHFPPCSVGGKQAVLVCKTCNSKAGADYDYSLKDWLQEQAFVNAVPGNQFPVSMEFDGVQGKYKESLVSNGRMMNFGLDRFARYSNVSKFLNEFPAKPFKINLQFRSTDMKLVYKALIKAAYLKAFYLWGYDFIYTATGMKMREVFFNDVSHILTNYGVFFYTDVFPPQGLCYTYMPAHLQTFMLNFTITDVATNYTSGVSVLVPGPNADDWENLQHYQPTIDQKGNFINGLIQLPEDTLSKTCHFPYTQTWQNRHTFRIEGFNDK